VRELLPANDNSANSIGIVFGMARAPAIAMNVARRFEDLIVAKRRNISQRMNSPTYGG
jgi:hypothetical protein